MRRAAFTVALLLAGSAFAAPPLFKGSTESKWTIDKGTSKVGTLTVLTSATGTRAEFRAASGPATVFLGGQSKVWMRSAGGDVELTSANATSAEAVVAPSLLLPFTTSPSDAVQMKNGAVASYSYRGAKALYTNDANGPAKVEITSGSTRYTLVRTSLSTSHADASNFEVRPKKGAASRLARLSGDLLGSSDTNVSATAGGRGAGTKGLTLKDGGDYAAVAKVENRDAGWKPKLDAALEEFQKDGKIGKARENQ